MTSCEQFIEKKEKYYNLLNVSTGASEEEIKASYKKLAMKWHPDKNQSPNATSKFQEISYAYRKLTSNEDSDSEDGEFSAQDIFLSVFGPLFRGRKASKVVFNMSDFQCAHHREFASRFFDSSSDSEWDSDDSYYDYEYDTDEDDEDSDSEFFYSFHTHSSQKQPKPKEQVVKKKKIGVPDRPQPPRLLNSTTNSLKISWDAPNCNGAPILHYWLEMDSGIVAGADFNEIYKGKKRSYEVKQLAPGTTYHFLVKGANKFGTGGFSRVASFVTKGSVPQGNNKTNTSNKTTRKKRKRKKRKKKKPNGAGGNGTNQTKNISNAETVEKQKPNTNKTNAKQQNQAKTKKTTRQNKTNKSNQANVTMNRNKTMNETINHTTEEDSEEDEEDLSEEEEIAVVKLSGLPWQVNTNSLLDFFSDLSPLEDEVYYDVTEEGRPTGEAYACFVDSRKAQEALSRNTALLGNRYISIERSSKNELDEAITIGKAVKQDKIDELNFDDDFDYTEFQSTKGRSKRRSRARARAIRAKENGQAEEVAKESRAKNLQALLDMGFNEDVSRGALDKCETLQAAVDYLTPQYKTKSKSSFHFRNDHARRLPPNDARLHRLPVNGTNGTGFSVSAGFVREKQLSSSLWIGNVSPKIREEELRTLFSPYGEIVSLKILRRSQCAFVNYSSPGSATAAKRHVQGKILRDMRLEINFSKPPKSQRREERGPSLNVRSPSNSPNPHVPQGISNPTPANTERLGGIKLSEDVRIDTKKMIPDNLANDVWEQRLEKKRTLSIPPSNSNPVPQSSPAGAVNPSPIKNSPVSMKKAKHSTRSNTSPSAKSSLMRENHDFQPKSPTLNESIHPLPQSVSLDVPIDRPARANSTSPTRTIPQRPRSADVMQGLSQGNIQGHRNLVGVSPHHSPQKRVVQAIERPNSVPVTMEGHRSPALTNTGGIPPPVYAHFDGGQLPPILSGREQIPVMSMPNPPRELERNTRDEYFPAWDQTWSHGGRPGVPNGRYNVPSQDPYLFNHPPAKAPNSGLPGLGSFREGFGGPNAFLGRSSSDTGLYNPQFVGGNTGRGVNERIPYGSGRGDVNERMSYGRGVVPGGRFVGQRNTGNRTHESEGRNQSMKQPAMAPSSYGLFGWQPPVSNKQDVERNTNSTKVPKHLSMNIWL